MSKDKYILQPEDPAQPPITLRGEDVDELVLALDLKIKDIENGLDGSPEDLQKLKALMDKLGGYERMERWKKEL
jgi:hypothetical protein